jgi:hypothetical protein
MNQRGGTPDVDGIVTKAKAKARARGKKPAPDQPGKPNGSDPPAATVPTIDLQDFGPVIAELIQHGTQNGKPVKKPSRKFFAVVRAIHSRGHTFEAALATLQANPNGVHARLKDLQAELRQVWDQLDEVPALIAEFNAKYFVVNENGHTCIYAPRHDPILNRRVFDHMSFADLEKLYLNRRIRVGEKATGEASFCTAATAWLTHDERHQYRDGITFDPSERKCPPDVLNLWQGFAVKPRPGAWPLMQAHLHEIICGGVAEYRDYLLDLMADLVQNPGKPAEVAVVLKGEEGSGKGIVARAVKYLLGQHGLVINDAKHLAGNFNFHLRDCVLVIGDEVFVTGDKKLEAVLKALITDPYILIEGKFRNAAQHPNFVHVWLLTNNDWAVPASLRSRRWFVLQVLDTKVGDHAYFAAIQQEMENGGYEAMLHDLLHRDISKRNLRAVPVTDALVVQRKHSLGTIEAWWMNCLHRGYVFVSKLGLEEHWQKWHPFLSTEVLFESYSRYCHEHHERHPLHRELFGLWLKDSGAKAAQPRNQPVGEHLTDVTTTQGHRSHTARVAKLILGQKPHGYRLGTLDSARRAFCKASGLVVDWGRKGRKR